MAVSEPRRNALETLANDVFVSDDIVNLTNLQIRRSPTAKTQGQWYVRFLLTLIEADWPAYLHPAPHRGR